jgi:excisionase family DNA binding protein
LTADTSHDTNHRTDRPTDPTNKAAGPIGSSMRGEERMEVRKRDGHPPDVAPRVLTISEAAAYLNVTVRFMRRLVDERRIAFVKVGKFVRFERADLDAFIQAGRVEASRVA